MMTGKIKRVVADKGFGFIASDDGVDRFFHASGIRKPLQLGDVPEGTLVTFEDEVSPKGPRACDVAPKK